MKSFCCLQVSFIRPCGKYSPSNFDVKKKIDLYNIILLRSIDVITSFVCIVNIDVFLLTLDRIILKVLMLLYFFIILIDNGLLIPFIMMLIGRDVNAL